MYLNDIVDKLFCDVRIIVNTCFLDIGNEREAVSLLWKLRKANYTAKYHPGHLCDVAKHMIQCNVLFYHARDNKLSVQNRLLQRAVEAFLDEWHLIEDV